MDRAGRTRRWSGWGIHATESYKRIGYSALIRTALVVTEGSRFIVADFSAIKARILACGYGGGVSEYLFVNLPSGRKISYLDYFGYKIVMHVHDEVI